MGTVVRFDAPGVHLPPEREHTSEVLGEFAAVAYQNARWHTRRLHLSSRRVISRHRLRPMSESKLLGCAGQE